MFDYTGKKKVLSVKNLHAGFNTKDGYIPAVDGVTFDIYEGESVALVGESGSGKSVTAMSLLKILDDNAVLTADELKISGVDIMPLNEKQMLSVRGSKASMVFQEPMSSLNPLQMAGKQIAEAMELHTSLSKEEIKDQVVEIMREVGIADPERRAANYPHQMSGGMRQRVMIAMALSCDPDLLIADEPTTALDVTIQAQILDLIASVQRKRNMALLLITHNLGVVADVADKILIMYAGQIVEACDADTLFSHPWHPYCHGLLQAVPAPDNKDKRLYVIKGMVPSPLFFSKACRFNPRCPYATEQCRKEAPPFTEMEPGHFVRCFYPLSDERGELK